MLKQWIALKLRSDWLLKAPNVLRYSPASNSCRICVHDNGIFVGNTDFQSSFWAILCQFFSTYLNNYSLWCRWLAVDIYLTHCFAEWQDRSWQVTFDKCAHWRKPCGRRIWHRPTNWWRKLLWYRQLLHLLNYYEVLSLTGYCALLVDRKMDNISRPCMSRIHLFPFFLPEIPIFNTWN